MFLMSQLSDLCLLLTDSTKSKVLIGTICDVYSRVATSACEGKNALFLRDPGINDEQIKQLRMITRKLKDVQ